MFFLRKMARMMNETQVGSAKTRVDLETRERKNVVAPENLMEKVFIYLRT